jgi:eukaryotic-like serine/threonine-protein kinase
VADDTSTAVSSASRRGTRVDLGRLIGRYVLLSELGEGGGGVVYAAYDPQLDRKIALKVMHRESGLVFDEARALAQFNHPNIVTIHDVGRLEHQSFVAMELVQGESLAVWRRSRSPREIMRVLADAGRGLAAAHARGIIHRDVKPSNILVDHEGRARLADFGLARVVALAGESSAVEGTPGFIAPECFDGGAPGIASDIYAFAVTCVEGLTGHTVFAGEDETARLGAQRRLELSRDFARELPSSLWPTLSRALAVDPAIRPSRVEDLVDALARASSPRRGRWLVVASLIAVAAAIMVTVVASRPGATRDESCRLDAIAAIDRAMPQETLRRLDEKFRRAPAWLVDLWPRMRAELISGQTDWIARYRAACGASTPAANRQLACLSDRADELHVTLEELAAAPDDALARVRGQFAEAARSAARCASSDLPRISTQDREVTAASWQRRTGGAKQAMPRLLSVANDEHVATATRARAWSEASMAANALADAEHSEEYARRAFADALRGNDDTTASVAALRLSEAAVERQDLVGAENWAGVSEAIADRIALEGRDRLHADILGQRGMIARARGDQAAMMAAFRAELAMRAEVFGPRSAETIGARLDLGRELTRTGDVAGGIRELAEALAIAEQALGPGAPDVAQVLESLGGAHVLSGDRVRGQAELSRAIEIVIATYGADHPNLATMYSNLANAYMTNREFARAIELQSRSVDIFMATRGQNHATTALALQRLAHVQMTAGNLDAARASAQRALDIARRALPADHRDLGVISRTLANIELRSDRFDEARRAFVTARSIAARQLGEDHIDTLEAADGVAWVDLLVGRPALEPLSQVVARMEQAKLTSNPRYAVFLYRRAEAERRAKLFAKARVTATQALGVAKESGVRAAIELALAQILDAVGAPPIEVAAQLSRAVALNEEVGGSLESVRAIRQRYGCVNHDRCVAPNPR